MSLPIGHGVSFTLPRPVASSKNRRRIFARRGKKMGKKKPGFVSLPSEQAVSDVAMIRAAVAKFQAFGPNDALQLDYAHNVTDDTITVLVTKIRELPTKGRRGTKRDVHGMLETIADALQGVLYPNDNQIDAGSFERVRT